MIDWQLKPSLQYGKVARAVVSAGPRVDVGGLAGREGRLMFLGYLAAIDVVVVAAVGDIVVVVIDAGVEGRRGVEIDLALAIGGLSHGDG